MKKKNTHTHNDDTQRFLSQTRVEPEMRAFRAFKS